MRSFRKWRRHRHGESLHGAEKRKEKLDQEEAYEIFASRGFRKVFMEELSLGQQIDLMSSAEMIAGPTGAAWTNLIFCAEGARCLCWMADESKEFSAYSNLAQTVGVDLRYVTYTTGAKSTGELYSLNYQLDAKILEEALETLLLQDCTQNAKY